MLPSNLFAMTARFTRSNPTLSLLFLGLLSVPMKYIRINISHSRVYADWIKQREDELAQLK